MGQTELQELIIQNAGLIVNILKRNNTAEIKQSKTGVSIVEIKREKKISL